MQDLAGGDRAALVGAVLSGRLPRVLWRARRAVAPVFAAFFGADEAAKVALGAMLPYFDDDPARLSFLLYAGNWARYCAGGSYNLAGGSATLTRPMVDTVLTRGGAAQRRCTVTRILADRAGRAKGVVWTEADGSEQVAKASVVLAGTAPVNVAAMLPEALVPDFLRRYRGNEPSVSLFSVALGLSRPAAEFGIGAFSTFVIPDDVATFAALPEAAARSSAGAGRRSRSWAGPRPPRRIEPAAKIGQKGTDRAKGRPMTRAMPTAPARKARR